jgi:hypothetical protein
MATYRYDPGAERRAKEKTKFVTTTQKPATIEGAELPKQIKPEDMKTKGREAVEKGIATFETEKPYKPEKTKFIKEEVKPKKTHKSKKDKTD